MNPLMVQFSWVLSVSLASDIEVQSELPRMGAKPNGIDLSLSLVLKPGLDDILGKHIAPQ
jgi:hypothetical protein